MDLFRQDPMLSKFFFVSFLIGKFGKRLINSSHQSFYSTLPDISITFQCMFFAS